jgi:hypothetical protein
MDTARLGRVSVMADPRPRNVFVESPSEYGEWGYWNRWGGFHRTTDREAYWVFLTHALRHPLDRLWLRAMWRMARDRWRHRRCNTSDFHHYACTLDPFGKALDDRYRWQMAWLGKYVGDGSWDTVQPPMQPGAGR